MDLKNEIKVILKWFWRYHYAQKAIKICFTYLEELSGYYFEKKRFKSKTGYNLNLKNPKSFNEKIVWKKIYDRNPLYPVVADKYKVRDYIKDVLGKEEADNILIPLLYVTDNPDTIPFDDLSDEYIIKANHGSGTNIIVDKNKVIDRQKIINQCKEWLSTPYGFFKHEWAYQEIDRKIIIEKLLKDENDKIPTDYKFHMIHGKCAIIQVIWDREQNTKESLFDINWNLIDETLTYPKGGIIEKPSNLKEMVNLASTLSTQFDYVRVDLYSMYNKIYFGELTCYPGSGFLPKPSLKFDFEFGDLWTLNANHILYNQET